MKKENKELVLFHIYGGGGNSKTIEFYSMGGITTCPEWDNLFTQEDEEGGVIALTDCNGNELMDAEEYNKAITTGVWRLEIDWDYNTWYTCPLRDIEEDEFLCLDDEDKEIYLKEIFHYSDEDLDGEDLNDIYSFGVNED